MQFKIVQRLNKEELQPAYKVVEVWVDIDADYSSKYEYVGITSSMESAKALCKEFATSFKIEYINV
jgi:hypothetical protein